MIAFENSESSTNHLEQQFEKLNYKHFNSKSSLKILKHVSHRTIYLLIMISLFKSNATLELLDIYLHDGNSLLTKQKKKRKPVNSNKLLLNGLWIKKKN